MPKRKKFEDEENEKHKKQRTLKAEDSDEGSYLSDVANDEALKATEALPTSTAAPGHLEGNQALYEHILNRENSTANSAKLWQLANIAIKAPKILKDDEEIEEEVDDEAPDLSKEKVFTHNNPIANAKQPPVQPSLAQAPPPPPTTTLHPHQFTNPRILLQYHTNSASMVYFPAASSPQPQPQYQQATNKRQEVGTGNLLTISSATGFRQFLVDHGHISTKANRATDGNTQRTGLHAKIIALVMLNKYKNPKTNNIQPLYIPYPILHTQSSYTLCSSHRGYISFLAALCLYAREAADLVSVFVILHYYLSKKTACNDKKDADVTNHEGKPISLYKLIQEYCEAVGWYPKQIADQMQVLNPTLHATLSASVQNKAAFDAENDEALKLAEAALSSPDYKISMLKDAARINAAAKKREEVRAEKEKRTAELLIEESDEEIEEEVDDEAPDLSCIKPNPTFTPTQSQFQTSSVLATANPLALKAQGTPNVQGANTVANALVNPQYANRTSLGVGNSKGMGL